MAAGKGLCVEADQFGGDISILDEDLEVVHRIGVSGIPSRARVSPDGRLGSTTLFVTGHSYSEGGFSTATVLVDMETGTEIANLEEFTVMRDGRPFDAVDFNFWGVTFAEDSNRFYATLGTGGSTYLLEGDVARRELTVLRDNVECPSLSPDGTRIAFKKRVDGGGLFEPIRWQLHLLDLATMEETALGDTRNVDDQVEWIDDEHLVYAVQDEGPPATLRPDLWMLPLDGSPQRIAYGASSPVTMGDLELSAAGA
jgi:Tol biopolymer transport system component